MGRNWTGIFHFLIAGFTFDFCLIRLEPTITGNKFQKKRGNLVEKFSSSWDCLSVVSHITKYLMYKITQPFQESSFDVNLRLLSFYWINFLKIHAGNVWMNSCQKVIGIVCNVLVFVLYNLIRLVSVFTQNLALHNKQSVVREMWDVRCDDWGLAGRELKVRQLINVFIPLQCERQRESPG